MILANFPSENGLGAEKQAKIFIHLMLMYAIAQNKSTNINNKVN